MMNRKNYIGLEKEPNYIKPFAILTISAFVWPVVLIIIVAALKGYSDPSNIMEYNPLLFWSILMVSFILSMTTWMLVYMDTNKVSFKEYWTAQPRASLLSTAFINAIVMAVSFGWYYQKECQLEQIYKIRGADLNEFHWVRDMKSQTYIATPVHASTDIVIFTETVFDNTADSIVSEYTREWEPGKFFHFYGLSSREIPNYVIWGHRKTKPE